MRRLENNRYPIAEEHKAKIKKWWDKRKGEVFIISGYAGCGKTTLARQIPELLGVWDDDYQFLTPTGKAALVLGMGAKTIHSYRYKTIEDPLTGALYFVPKDPSDFTEKLLIIDEISMVNEDILKDLRELEIPIIGLGDRAQLPPVSGNSRILNRPDIMLTTVHRNDGGLLQLATDIRRNIIPSGDYNNVEFREDILRDLRMVKNDAIILTRFNKTRHIINRKYREVMRNYYDILHVGEQLIVLENKYSTSLRNGSIVTVTEIEWISKGKMLAGVTVRDEMGLEMKIMIGIAKLMEADSEYRYYDQKVIPVDYGYAITCHKAQGSEWDEVFVIKEGYEYGDWSRWYYTAVTRARKKLYVY